MILKAIHISFFQLISAPQVIMDRLYKAVWEKVSEGGEFEQAVFKFAFDYKKKNYEAGFSTPLIDK